MTFSASFSICHPNDTMKLLAYGFITVRNHKDVTKHAGKDATFLPNWIRSCLDSCMIQLVTTRSSNNAESQKGCPRHTSDAETDSALVSPTEDRSLPLMLSVD